MRRSCIEKEHADMKAKAEIKAKAYMTAETEKKVEFAGKGHGIL